MESHKYSTVRMYRKVILLVLVIVMILVNIVVYNTSSIRGIISEIELLSQEVDDYKSQFEELSKIKNSLEKKNDELERRHLEDSKTLKSYESKLVSLKKTTVTSKDTGFRSWMPYTAISRTSSQWKIVSKAISNEYGVLEISGRAVVAIGTGWGLRLGDSATVITNQGSFEIIVGDIKANAHTDSTSKVTVSNGCVVEFIVDRSSLDKRILTSGNVASISKYAGKVVSINKL